MFLYIGAEMIQELICYCQNPRVYSSRLRNSQEEPAVVRAGIDRRNPSKRYDPDPAKQFRVTNPPDSPRTDMILSPDAAPIA